MSEWQQLQSSLSSALVHLDLNVPQGIKKLKGGTIPKKRFSVYRNNVALSLMKVLASTYPVVEEIVGEEFFAIMAKEFAMSHLPHSPVMITYGEEFSGFLKSFPPVEHLPYLSDIAQLEWHRNSAYHGADGSPLPIEVLSEVSEEQLPHLRFDLLPTLKIIKSNFPITSIWNAHQQDTPARHLEGIDMQQGETALILRPELDVLVNKVSRGTYEFVKSLKEGKTFALSVEQTIVKEPTFDISANLAGLFNLRAVTGIQ